ncbi:MULTISPECIES: SsgA family sporulation/cell division regulator [Streptomyces]|uniref:SsgA family sporulation/cell division regulator n=1 Tax=Streptomyces TaxID=1883 RepID=UPI0004CD44BB|nr:MULTISPECIES: SsgA family sporulation/cell division regulator [Streptomyces]KOT57082.1 SsgG protein [Streptomyces rimosus subsp. rimosus]
MGFPGLELKIRMSLVAGSDSRVFIPVRLYYKNTDPYAVQFSFDVTPDDVVRWTFSRELLVQGLTAPAGIGDVKITPIGSHQNHRFNIELEPPGGYARLEGPAAPVKAWLAKTFEVVPAGRESESVDIDSFLDELLPH